MDNEMPAYIMFLVAALILSLLGMLSAGRETLAVQNLRRWPFRAGIPVLRFRCALPVAIAASERTLTTSSAVGRVFSSSEILFAPQEWRSHLSWNFSTGASPYALKGYARVDQGEVEVVGRLSIAASVSIPGMAVWLGGGAVLALTQASWGIGMIALAFGVLFPIILTWRSLPRERERFRAVWDEIRDRLSQPSFQTERGGRTRG